MPYDKRSNINTKKSLQKKVINENKPLDNIVNIKSNERVFICGKTGSGKSTLTRYLLMPSEHLIVIDGKDSEDTLENWNLEPYNREKHLKAIKNHEYCRIRLVNNMEDIIEVLNAIYEYGNHILYIDELTATIPPRTKAPAIFTDIWTRGRARNIGAWAGTQRPSQIPLEFISESEHLFIFKLTLENDRKRVSMITGNKVLPIPKDKFGFYYYNVNDGKLYYFKRLAI